MANNNKKDIELTDQNFTMLKHIQHGKSVKEAYELAGYQGANPQAPYQLYHKIKKKLEQIYEADNVDSLRLKIEAKKILDMQVNDEPVKPEVKLRAIETLRKLTEQNKSENKAISPFIVFKADDGQITASQGKVIDVKEVENDADDAA